MKPTFWIGIDPGTDTGIAVWNAQAKRLASVASYPIHEALQLLASFEAVEKQTPGSVMVVLEDARKMKWFGDNQMQKKGRLMGAGSIRRDSKIWEDYLKSSKIPYMKVQPKKGKKVDADTFLKYTGWNKQTNNHARDAAMMVFQR